MDCVYRVEMSTTSSRGVVTHDFRRRFVELNLKSWNTQRNGEEIDGITCPCKPSELVNGE